MTPLSLSLHTELDALTARMSHRQSESHLKDKVHTHTHSHTQTRTCTHMDTCVPTHAITQTYAHTCTCTCTRRCTHTHTRVHARTHARTDTHTRTHAHTHTHTNGQNQNGQTVVTVHCDNASVLACLHSAPYFHLCRLMVLQCQLAYCVSGCVVLVQTPLATRRDPPYKCTCAYMYILC